MKGPVGAGLPARRLLGGGLPSVTRPAGGRGSLDARARKNRV